MVWICTDQQRFDSLGCAGNPVARTPHIDSIAARGTRISGHVTPCQMCSPSRATMFTGLYPRHHQLTTNGRALDPALPTLPGLLADAGWRTHGVGKHHLQPILAPVEHGMPDSRAFWRTGESHAWRGPYYGLQTMDLLIGEAETATIAGHYARWLAEEHPEAMGLLGPEASSEPPPRDLDEIWRSAMPAELHYNGWITDRAVSYVEQANDPFFLFVSYPDPHHPFAPPEPWADRFDPAAMPLPRVDPGELDRMPPYYRDLYPFGEEGFRAVYWSAPMDLEQGALITTESVSEASLRRAIAYTYATIEMIDHGIGRLLAALRRRGMEDDTIVLFTSDHGELLGTHGLLHKGPPPYRQLVEVSMIVAGPGIASDRTVDALTSHIDLAPTFADLLGVATDGIAWDGLSLRPLLAGEVSSVRDASFCEYHPIARGETYNQSVITDRWRLTLYPERPGWGELFDRAADPDEHVNLFGEPACEAVATELGDLLASRFPPQPTVASKPLAKW